MNAWALGALSSVGLGALTVLHPCPLSANIAAVSIMAAWRSRPGLRVLTFVLFVMGEMVTFAVLGVLISAGIVKISGAADSLQLYMRQFLGPILIVIGMMLSGLLWSRQHRLRFADRFLRMNPGIGLFGGLILGVLMALSFCPMTAALFFGVLLPLAVAHDSGVIYPVLYGLGSGLPLVLIVLIISRGVFLIERAFPVRESTEKILRASAGAVIIVIGLLMSLRNTFDML